MTRFVYATAVGLVGALLVHLAIVFLLPLLSEQAVFNKLAERVVLDRPAPLETLIDGEDASPPVDMLDPFFQTAICRFDLSRGGLLVRANGRLPFWSVSVFDSRADSFFSANDRITAGQRLDLAVLDAGQMRYARQNEPENLATAVIAAADSPQGFVVVRGFVPDESWRAVAAAFFDALQCGSLDF